MFLPLEISSKLLHHKQIQSLRMLTSHLIVGPRESLMEMHCLQESKKQMVIVLSSMEAEYVALSEAGREGTWLRNLYSELRFPQTNPTIIKGDNDGSVVLTHNPQFHQQSKHIALCHHWVRDLVTDKILDIQNCRCGRESRHTRRLSPSEVLLLSSV